MKKINPKFLLEMKTNLVRVDMISGCFFKLKNNADFHFMIGLTYGIYLKFVGATSEELIEEVCQNKEQLNNIIEKLFVSNEYIILDEEELYFVYKFISFVCDLLLESDGVDFSNKHMIRYFKISQSVVKAISKETEKIRISK